MRYARAHEERGNMGDIQDAVREGKIGGLKLALELALMQRQEGGDIDYLITSLQELIKQLDE